MCLYPKLIRNKRYCPTKKNGGKVPFCIDTSVLYVPAECGKCWECRKKKARSWQIRLTEESKTNEASFVTMTFNDEALNKFTNDNKNYDECNKVAKRALRLCLERIRKETGKSIRHWFTTELGEENDRIHLHGIIWGKDAAVQLAKHWKYGYLYIGWVTSKSISYVTKYMLKNDEKHKGYVPIVLCSPGIGSSWLNTTNAKRCKFNGEYTKEEYIYPDGHKSDLPVYYRDKLYTDDEREILFSNKIKKGYIWISGQKVRTSDIRKIVELKEAAQQKAISIHNDDPQEWKRKKYAQRFEHINNISKVFEI